MCLCGSIYLELRRYFSHAHNLVQPNEISVKFSWVVGLLSISFLSCSDSSRVTAQSDFIEEEEVGIDSALCSRIFISPEFQRIKQLQKEMLTVMLGSFDRGVQVTDIADIVKVGLDTKATE